MIGISTFAILLAKRRDLLVHAFDPTHARAIGLPVRVLHYGLLALLSLAIVGALKAVGIILSVALLIMPVRSRSCRETLRTHAGDLGRRRCLLGLPGRLPVLLHQQCARSDHRRDHDHDLHRHVRAAQPQRGADRLNGPTTGAPISLS